MVSLLYYSVNSLVCLVLFASSLFPKSRKHRCDSVILRDSAIT